MIRFHLLELLNFGPYARASVPLDKEGLIFIRGIVHGSSAFDSNGAGKSMLANAISWCLFERPAYRVPLRRGAANGYVRLAGNIDIRGKTRELSICRKLYGNKSKTLELVVGGKDISDHTLALTQDKVNELLGMKADTFLNTYFYRQGQLIRFYDMTDSQKKELLKEASNTVEIDGCREEVRRRITDLEAQSREAELELSEAEGLIVKLEADIKSYQIQEGDFQDLVKEELDKLQKKIAKAEKGLVGLEGIGAKLNKVEKVIQELSKENNRLSGEIGRIAGNQESYREQELGLNKAKGSCPLCERALSAQLKAKLKDSLADRIEKAAVEKDQLKLQQRELAVKLNKKREQQHDLSASFHQKKLLQNDMRSAQAEIQKQEKADNPFTRLLRKACEELSAYTRRRTRLSMTVGGVRQSIEKLEPWADGFGNRGVIARILSMVVDRLDVRTNEYLALLTGKELRVNIESSLETKSKKITDRIDIKTVVSGKEGIEPSGGQSKRIAVAMGMALADLVSEGSRSINLLVLDEVSSGLDETGKLALFSLLEHVAEKAHETVLVIDHDPEVAENFDKIITVEMENGESTVEIGWR